MINVQNRKSLFMDCHYAKLYSEEYNSKYKITLNGQDCFINPARVSKYPFNMPWNGHQRKIEQTEINGFISFSADEEVDIVIETFEKAEKVKIKPISQKIDYSYDGKYLKFKLKKQGQYVVELNDKHESIYIFFDDINDFEKKNSATYYFGPGIHKCGIITLKNNESIYVDRDAIVLASVYAKDAKNISIFGHGILDGSTEERFMEHCYAESTVGNIKMYNCENITIDGVILRDSAIWVASFFECNNISINNIKIIGQWRYNTDGIDLCNTNNVSITNSFIRSFDDTISIKGLYDFEKYIENITVDNCVLWCDWGKTCEIGAETGAVGYRNITFKNSDCIHNQFAALDIQNCDNADIHDIFYKNINVEYSLDETKFMIEDDEHTSYNLQDKLNVAAIIKLDNSKTIYNFSWGDGTPGKIHDIYFENINMYVEDTDKIKPYIHIISHFDDCIFTDIKIKNIQINEKKITADEIITNIENAKNTSIE